MRILHVAQPTDGGTAVVVRQLTRAGVRAGDEVVVACPSGDLAQWAQQEGAAWLPLDLTRQPGTGDVRAVPRLRGLARDADVLHLHSSKAGAVGRIAVLGLGTRRPRVVFTPHGWSWYVGGRAAPVYRLLERALAPCADAIVAVSAREAADGRAVLGSRARVVVVENGVDTDRFAPEGPQAARGGRPLLVHVGRLSRQKAQDRSVEMLARLDRGDVVLRLVGGGDPGEVLALARDCGVEDRVEVVGATDPRPHLRAADVVVLPARWEGMPLALLEAMACGAAIVTTDVGGSDALGDAGVVVPGAVDHAVVEGLALSIGGLLASAERRSELGGRARRRAVARFSLARTVAAYDSLWRGH